MSQSQSQSDTADAQPTLFDTDEYQHETSDDALPEDITHEFGIPDNPLDILDISVDTIAENIKPAWKDAEELYGQSDTPEWSGAITADDLLVVLSHLQPTIDEIKIAISEDGWGIKVVDPANVCLFRVWIDADEFDTYNLETEGVAAINVGALDDTLSMAADDEPVQISIDGDTRKMEIDDGTSVELSLIDPDSLRRVPDIPDLDINQSVTLPGSEWKETINRLTDITDHVEIRTDTEANHVEFVAEADTMDATKAYTTKADLISQSPQQTPTTQFNTDVNESVMSLFSGDYLAKFFRGLNQNDIMDSYTAAFGDEHPMKLHSDISDNTHIFVMLAPRISA